MDYAKQLEDPLSSDISNAGKRHKSTACTWFKRNSVLLALIGLAISGIALSCVFFFQPCPKIRVSAPVDVVLAFDGSGSIRRYSGKFERLMDSGAELVRDLSQNLTNSTFQVGVLQWASRSPRIELALTSNVTKALKSLDSEDPYPELQSEATWFATALAACGSMLKKSLSKNAFQMCIVFSDGLNLTKAIPTHRMRERTTPPL